MSKSTDSDTLNTTRSQKKQSILSEDDHFLEETEVRQKRRILQKDPYRKARFSGWRAAILLVLSGLVLELLCLALFPLFINDTQNHDPVRDALSGLFPQVTRFYWPLTLPTLAQQLAHVSWLDPASAIGRLNLSFGLLLLASLITLLASTIGTVLSHSLPGYQVHLLFAIVMTLTAVFGLTFFFAPISNNIFSQDMLIYGLNGRMVASYGANPYLVKPNLFPQDMLLALINGTSRSTTTTYGTVWVDLTILVALIARESVANFLLVFRGIGLVAHIGSAMLLWNILNRLKPESRLTGTILYAWNPIVLFFSIPAMHYEVLIVFFVLLATLFFLRESPTIGWVFVLLAALAYPLLLLLLPLFLHLLIRKSSFLHLGQRLLWWLGMTAITLLIVTLAYAPYWSGWSLVGIGQQIRASFWQDNTINSLNTVIINLPILLPDRVSWVVAPEHWSLIVLILAGCLLLFGIWLATTVELTLLVGGWLFLLLTVLQPVYWPWYILLPLALALCSNHRGTIVLTVLLVLSSLVSYYSWQQQTPWAGQGLGTIGLPLLLWGWFLFIFAIRHRTQERIILQSAPVGRLARRSSRPEYDSDEDL